MPPRKRPAAAAKKRPAAKEEKRSRTANLDLPTITNLLSSHIAEVCSTGYLCCISGSALAMASKGGRRLILKRRCPFPINSMPTVFLAGKKPISTDRNFPTNQVRKELSTILVTDSAFQPLISLSLVANFGQADPRNSKSWRPKREGNEVPLTLPRLLSRWEMLAL